MTKPVKIRYERQTGKGAAMFVGMVYYEDGSKRPIADARQDLAGVELPIEHDGLPGRLQAPLVRFPQVPRPTAPTLKERPPAPLWPLIPKR